MKQMPEMTPEEFDAWLKDHASEMKAAGERQAQNYLATERANTLARETIESRKNTLRKASEDSSRQMGR